MPKFNAFHRASRAEDIRIKAAELQLEAERLERRVIGFPRIDYRGPVRPFTSSNPMKAFRLAA